LLASALAQTTPAGWKIVKDSKGVCQIAVPPDWEPLPETAGAAVFHDVTTAIAVVTSQAGQAFQTTPGNLAEVVRHPQGQTFREYGEANLLSGQDFQAFGRPERI
jgi:hypothetical protein